MFALPSRYRVVTSFDKENIREKRFRFIKEPLMIYHLLGGGFRGRGGGDGGESVVANRV